MPSTDIVVRAVVIADGRKRGGRWRPLARAARVLLLAASLVVVPSPAAAAADAPQCDTWSEAVVGPSTRSIQPVAAWWLGGEALTPTDLARLLGRK